MKHAIDAIYENGTFRPIERDAVAIADGQRVRITIDDQCEPEALRLAMTVYDGLSDKDIDEVEQIALDRGKNQPRGLRPYCRLANRQLARLSHVNPSY